MKERLIYDTLIIDQSFLYGGNYEKALIIVFIMCLLGMIFYQEVLGYFMSQLMFRYLLLLQLF